MRLIHITFAASAVSTYDKLATTHPNLATSLVSFSTYTCAELVRQSLLSKKSIQSKSHLAIEDVDATCRTNATDNELAVPLRGGTSLNQQPSFDLRQGTSGVILMGLLGALLHAPWISVWFSFLEAAFPRKSPLDIAAKICLDQVVGCPFYFVLIGMATGLSEGYGITGAIRRIKADMWRAVRLSWVAWPLLHAINFAFVPHARRKLLIQLGGLMWAILLCKITAKNAHEEMNGLISSDQMEIRPQDQDRLKLDNCNLSPDLDTQ